MTKQQLILRCFVIPFLFLAGCTQDDLSPEATQESESIFQTANSDEVFNFFKTNTANTTFSSVENTSEGTPFIIPELDLTYQDELINTDAKLTIIPAITKYTGVNSRILLLKIKDTIQTVAFHMVADTSVGTTSFTGKYIITDLEGKLIEAYKVENEILTTKYVLKSNTTTSSANTSNLNENIVSSFLDDPNDGECDELYNPEDIFCDNVLDPVVISGGGGVTIFYIPWPTNVPTTGPDFGEGEFPSGGGGTGGGNGTGWDPLDVNCPPGQEYDYVLERCVAICNSGYQDNGSGICIKTPCKTIQDQIVNTQWASRVAILRGQTRLTQENGYRQTRNGTFGALSANPSGHSLNFNPSINDIGFLHTHLNNFSKDDNGDGISDRVKPKRIFSPGDINAFLAMVENARNNNHSISEVYGTVITSTGEWTIKFTGNPTNISRIFNPKNKLIIAEYNRLINRFNRERGLLKFIKNVTNNSGISLYKLNNDGTVEEVRLDANERKQTNPC